MKTPRLPGKLPSKLEDRYDWIVFGSHPAALLSACLVARLGLSVLILPIVPVLGLSISRKGQYFDPESNFLIGLGRTPKVDGLVYHCLQRLGVDVFEEDLVASQSNGIQVVTPGTRMVFGSSESVTGELHREFGKNYSKQIGLVHALKHSENDCLSFWLNLPKRLTIQEDTQKKGKVQRVQTLQDLRKNLLKSGNEEILQSWLSSNASLSDLSSKNRDFIDASVGLWYAGTSNINPDPRLFDLLHSLSVSRTAVAFRGGVTAYRDFLFSVAKSLGIHIFPKADCRRIFVEQGRFKGVQIATRGNMISARGGILGCSMERVLDRITYTGAHWRERRLNPPKPSGWKFTLSLTVRKEAIPNGMLNRLIWQEEDAPPLEVEVVNPTDYRLQEGEIRYLYLRTIMPYTAESLKPNYQRMISARMIRQAMEILPFLEYHVVKIYPDFRPESGFKDLEASSPANRFNLADGELYKIYGFPSLESIPDNLCVFDKDVGSESGIQGLFLASEASYPKLGTLGPVLAGMEATAWIAHQSGFAGPLS